MSYDERIQIPRWDDWRWAGSGVNPPGAPTPAVLTEVATNEWWWAFGDNAVMAFPDQQLPHDYLEGSDIQPHIHFTPTITGTYAATWTMVMTSFLSAANGTVKQAPFTTTVTVPNATYTLGTGYTIDAVALLAGLNRKISSLMTITLSLALPTKPGGGLLALTGFDGHYRKDGHGSRLITAK